MTTPTTTLKMRARLSPPLAAAASILAIFAGGCTSTPKERPVWVVSTSVDPITSIGRCVVAPPDTRWGISFTRTGYLYPFVENNSELGLLVGVSSGGPVRVPPGDIVWRVDSAPHRTLSAAETPVMGANTLPIDTSSMTDEMRRSVETSMAASAGMISSIQNGTTAVDGAKAEEILVEMRAGHELVFRAVAASQSLGLTNPSTTAVGRYAGKSQEPFPLDASFEYALQECGL